MISYNNNVFHIQGESFSYLFRITPQGYPEHLHFGDPVTDTDANALAVKPGLGWGGSVLADQKSSLCLDVLPLEWSASGRGDYREMPIALDSSVLDFHFRAYRIIDGSIGMDCGLPQSKGAVQTLELTLVSENGPTLLLYYSLFEDTLTRRSVLINDTQREISLHKLMSFCLDIPGSYQMTTFDGGWIREMGKTVTPVGMTRVVHESTTGFSSNRHQPGFLLNSVDSTENSGRVFGFNLIYSGNHYCGVQKSAQNLTRVIQGISPDNFVKKLLPGERFETPEAVLAYSSQGFGELSRKMHDFVNRHIVPDYWQGRERPVLYNSWEGCMFRFNHRRLVSLAKQAKALGCELFVLDDGWFGKRNDDKAGLGDYHVNEKKLPKGLQGLAEEINKLGMQFGLWFEPEAVNPDSDLYRAHPDWALTDHLNPVYGRNELLLDLTKPEVRDYIVGQVSSTLDSANISYVKWDMNRHSIALGLKAHEYILGLYDVLRRIFEPRPHILLETCSSGGNRFDLGMLCFGPQIWCSDDTDPVERLDIQTNLSYLYPQSTFGTHVSAAPHAQTLRNTPLTTRGNVSFFGCLGYELDLAHLVDVEKQEIKNQIAFYQQHRKLFQFGAFSRCDTGDGLFWQVSWSGEYMVGLFHKLVHAAPGYQQLWVRGLDKDNTYHLVSRPQALRVGQFGDLVKHISPISLNPNGTVLRTADHHYALPDGQLELTASGAAFMSGIMLNGRFCGTGYHSNMRQQGDFGSNVFFLKEE